MSVREMILWLASDHAYCREANLTDLSIEERIEYLEINFDDEDIISDYNEMYI